MEPSYKSPAINSFLDSLLPQGRDRVKLIQKDLCVTCLGHAKEFTNELVNVNMLSLVCVRHAKIKYLGVSNEIH